MARFTPTLIGEYTWDETVSALQKFLRRDMEYESAFVGYIIHQSGYGMYLFRRLSIIAAEDCGLGDPQALIFVSTMQQSWLQLHKQNKEATMDKFLLALQTILYLCRSKKTREGDSLSNLIHEHFTDGKRLNLDDYDFVKCPHTSAGRKVLGKFGNMNDGKEKQRLDLWFNHFAKITNLAYPDKWEEELKKIWYSRIPKDNK